MNNKIIIGALIILFSLSAGAYAKSKQLLLQELTAGDILAKMKVQLGLTDAQIEEIKPIIADYLDQEKQLKIEEKKRLSKVLTDQQLYTWNFLQNEVSKDKKKRAK